MLQLVSEGYCPAVLKSPKLRTLFVNYAGNFHYQYHRYHHRLLIREEARMCEEVIHKRLPGTIIRLTIPGQVSATANRHHELFMFWSQMCELCHGLCYIGKADSGWSRPLSCSNLLFQKHTLRILQFVIDVRPCTFKMQDIRLYLQRTFMFPVFY